MSQPPRRLAERTTRGKHGASPDRPVAVAVTDLVHGLCETFPPPLRKKEGANGLLLGEDARRSHRDESRLVGESSVRFAQVESRPKDRLLVVRRGLQRPLPPAETHVRVAEGEVHHPRGEALQAKAAPHPFAQEEEDTPRPFRMSQGLRDGVGMPDALHLLHLPVGDEGGRIEPPAPQGERGAVHPELAPQNPLRKPPQVRELERAKMRESPRDPRPDPAHGLEWGPLQDPGDLLRPKPADPRGLRLFHGELGKHLVLRDPDRAGDPLAERSAKLLLDLAPQGQRTAVAPDLLRDLEECFVDREHLHHRGVAKEDLEEPTGHRTVLVGVPRHEGHPRAEPFRLPGAHPRANPVALGLP